MPGEENPAPAPERTINHYRSQPANVGPIGAKSGDMPIARGRLQPSQRHSRRHLLRQCRLRSSCWERPSCVLLAPQRFDLAAKGGLHIIEREHSVLRYISTQHAAFREPDWESCYSPSRRSIVDEPIGTEPTNTVKAFASFQVSLGNGHHFTDWTSDWGNGRITMDNGSAYG